MSNLVLQYIGVTIIAIVALFWIVTKMHKARKNKSTGCTSCPLSSKCNQSSKETKCLDTVRKPDDV